MFDLLVTYALFRSISLDFATIVFLFVFGKYCQIMY